MTHKIRIELLEIAFERIIQKLQSENVEEVEIPFDLYRIIPTEKWEISNSKDDEVNIGSLYDDLECIEKLVLDKKRPCTYVDFDRVSSLLRIISEVNNPAES